MDRERSVRQANIQQTEKCVDWVRDANAPPNESIAGGWDRHLYVHEEDTQLREQDYDSLLS